MKKLNAAELRQKYLSFFKERGHTVIPAASLIPENDPTVLFTTAGMHPLVPYLLGEKHPAGTRLTNVQTCVRTGDIDEVGDASHCTFFEMLGNWSLGDYFKKESITWSFEFLTKELGIPMEKLAVSVFAGDEDAPRDEESADMWREQGLKPAQIFYLPKENNWWGPAGVTGPCGPDTEIFIDMGKEPCSKDCSPACNCGKYLEIWNNVFMQYNKTAGGKFEPLKKPNVDTGMGLERTVCILNGYTSVYEIDLFSGAIKLLEKLSGKKYSSDIQTMRAMRIIADHIRTATFMIGDVKGIAPSNVDQGYILRRLIRRAVRFGRLIGLAQGDIVKIAKLYTDEYEAVYSFIGVNRGRVLDEIEKEEERFLATIAQGLKEFEKVINSAAQRMDELKKSADILMPDMSDMGRNMGTVIEYLETIHKDEPSEELKTAIAYMKKARAEMPAEINAIQEVLAPVETLSERADIFADIAERTSEKLKEVSDVMAPLYKKFGMGSSEEFKNRFSVLMEFAKSIPMTIRILGKMASIVPSLSDDTIKGKTAFRLYDTFGFPLEMTEEMAREAGFKVDVDGFLEAFREHQKKSQAGAEQKFKGGLADISDQTAKLHTATHLLNQALKTVLGDEVNQKGSNITAERLRFDFSFSRPMTPEEIERVEDLVNEEIKKGSPVKCEEMTVGEAKDAGAVGVFGDRYGDTVKVYTIGFSKEICGGPHAESTAELGHFKIQKEQSSSAGVRRIKAVLE